MSEVSLFIIEKVYDYKMTVAKHIIKIEEAMRQKTANWVSSSAQNSIFQVIAETNLRNFKFALNHCPVQNSN